MPPAMHLAHGHVHVPTQPPENGQRCTERIHVATERTVRSLRVAGPAADSTPHTTTQAGRQAAESHVDECPVRYSDCNVCLERPPGCWFVASQLLDMKRQQHVSVHTSMCLCTLLRRCTLAKARPCHAAPPGHHKSALHDALMRAGCSQRCALLSVGCAVPGADRQAVLLPAGEEALQQPAHAPRPLDVLLLPGRVGRVCLPPPVCHHHFVLIYAL
jgi:hypothetical protein